MYRSIVVATALFATIILHAAAVGQVVQKKGGEIRINTPEVAGAYINPWPAKYEDAYWARIQPLLASQKGKIRTDVTGEHEKWSIPQTLLAYFAGGGDAAALKALQQGGGDGDHGHTDGVDFYWSFTLKGQARKYFLLKDVMDKGYVAKYVSGAKAWTAGDVKPNMELVLALDSPDEDVRKMALGMLQRMRAKISADLADKATNDEAKAAMLEYLKSPMANADFGADREKWRAWWKFFSDRGWKVFEEVERLINIRPHPKHGVGTGPVGGAWDPKVRGFWADARNTDNLRGMRETAAYLFAEEVGNEPVRKLYKEKIRRTAVAFMEMGMGEWDSTSYHMHSFAAYLNLYDFAKDEEVVGYAKAILDYLSAAGAVKYFHGAWAGPVKRDYGTSGSWDTTSEGFYPYFGSAPAKQAKPDLEHAFIFSSTYRPPMAIVKMGEKRVAEPFELFNSHPNYENWLPGKGERPLYHETMFYGTTFQMGTLSRGSDGYDTAGFKLAMRNAEGGADLMLVGTASGEVRRNNAVTTVGGDQIGQYRHMAMLLNTKAGSDFILIGPKGMKQETAGAATVLVGDQTWVALVPINAGDFAIDRIKPKQPKGGPKLSSYGFKGKGGAIAGMAVIVGDVNSHGSLKAFKQSIASVKPAIDGQKVTIAEGKRTLAVAYAEGEPNVWRDGKRHDWEKHFDVFAPAEGGDAPIHSGWKQRRLHVAYGGYTFTGTLTEDGRYVSENAGPGLK